MAAGSSGRQLGRHENRHLPTGLRKINSPCGLPGLAPREIAPKAIIEPNENNSPDQLATCAVGALGGYDRTVRMDELAERHWRLLRVLFPGSIGQSGMSDWTG